MRVGWARCTPRWGSGASQGDADHWTIAIYRASKEDWSEDELPTRFGRTTGTPEQGLDHTLGFWIGPPARA